MDVFQTLADLTAPITVSLQATFDIILEQVGLKILIFRQSQSILKSILGALFRDIVILEKETRISIMAGC